MHYKNVTPKPRGKT